MTWRSGRLQPAGLWGRGLPTERPSFATGYTSAIVKAKSLLVSNLRARASMTATLPATDNGLMSARLADAVAPEPVLH
jgi:hypothetical protein